MRFCNLRIAYTDNSDTICLLEKDVGDDCNHKNKDHDDYKYKIFSPENTGVAFT